MGRTWGIWMLGLCACRAPRASAPAEPVDLAAAVVEPSRTGTAQRLDGVAELARDVGLAADLGRRLERARTPYTEWVTDGAMSVVAAGLAQRRRALSEPGGSRLVQVSMSVDVDPALDRLLEALEH